MYELTDVQRAIVKSAKGIAETEFVEDAFTKSTDISWENV